MSSAKTVPGPKGVAFLGSLPQFIRDPLTFLTAMRDTYGDIVQFHLGHYHVYQINHPDYVQDVLVGQVDQFVKDDLDKAILRPAMGNGLVTNDGESHRQQRRLMQPVFHAKRIERFAQIMSDYTLDMLEDWNGLQTMDLFGQMSQLTLRIVAKTLYDVDMRGTVDHVGTAVEAINYYGGVAFRRGFTLPQWLPVREVRELRRAVQTLDSLLLPMIEARRHSQEDHGDLLSMLLLAQDEGGQGMSDKQLRDEVVTLFLAGHETTANALTWTWTLLSEHPEVEARLHAELDAVLGDRPPTLADLKVLPYTERVIKESMRLLPPAWSLNARRSVRDVDVDGYVIPQGARVFISPYVIHRDPRYYDQPERFMPERWENDFEKTLPRYAYMPFGGGPRVCIGNSFALMEARLLLATIAQRYRLRLTGPVEREPGVTLHPRGAVTAQLEARIPQPAQPEYA